MINISSIFIQYKQQWHIIVIKSVKKLVFLLKKAKQISDKFSSGKKRKKMRKNHFFEMGGKREDIEEILSYIICILFSFLLVGEVKLQLFMSVTICEIFLKTL